MTLFFVGEVIVCDESTYNANFANLASVPTDIPLNSSAVHLRYNRITNLTSGIFSHLSICMELYLGSNQISLIEPEAFIGLSNLRKLDLSYNIILRLGEDIFSALTNLDSRE